MLEIKLTVEATDLVNALNNLATAMGGANARVTPPAPTSQTPVMPPQPVSYPTPTAPQPVSYPAPSAPVQTMPTQAPNMPAPGVPLAQAPKYTTEQIMTAGAALVDAGRVNDLMALLNSFGVQAVTALKQEQLGAFATAMREMGAKI